ncbi:hypothetical protein MHY85_00965 [Cellulomonas sp. ACRRI]|uniref:hypothetical protein n=1 Tax=Cellulomonas sp. ACRRI TaxID=2918188 RepID=UPI001EF18A95|nr:hypothetical protein [Cellulomonas sp. ACRRI]MCG7284539.1 hypothetical protein [Cellulomonas sp. ACRRI]
MADVLAPVPPSVPVDRAREVGGRVTIADRVVARVARRAAERASTPVRHGPVGRDLPRVDVEVAGRRVRVAARVAGTWPEPAADVASRVAAAVRGELEALVGVRVDDVLVTVEAVVAAAPAGRRVS